MKIDDASILKEIIEEQNTYSVEFKALVLRLLHNNEGDVKKTSEQSCVSERTIYEWSKRWNSNLESKKKL
jgi:transposase-like protein